MKLLNTTTGRIVEVNPEYLRVRRLQKRVKAWCDRLKPGLDRVGIDTRLVMITLTYREGEEWKPGDIREFMRFGRHFMGNRLMAYAWVAELQKRGAVHYHVIMLVKAHTNIPVPDKSGWWTKGMSRIESAKTPYYLLTYTGKKYQKIGSYPKGIRIFAVWISPAILDGVAKWFFRLSSYPRWLVEEIWKDGNFMGDIKRVPGGGWMVGKDRYYSPWVIWKYDNAIVAA